MSILCMFCVHGWQWNLISSAGEPKKFYCIDLIPETVALVINWWALAMLVFYLYIFVCPVFFVCYMFIFMLVLCFCTCTKIVLLYICTCVVSPVTSDINPSIHHISLFLTCGKLEWFNPIKQKNKKCKIRIKKTKKSL